jgi:hypothetical protein
MDFAPIYLLQRLGYRIGAFFYHWYVGGSRVIGNAFISTLQSADEIFAVKITLQHFFEPLYNDYSGVGRVVGVVFRFGRVLIGAVIYGILALFFLAVYVLWLAVPVSILFFIITGRSLMQIFH